MAREYEKNLIVDAANRYGLDVGIALAQIQQESGFNPKAVSSAGAKGLAQFMPDTAKRFGLKDPFDPVQAAEAYGKYMSLLLKLFNGRYDLALAGYNWGENRAQLKTALRTGKQLTGQPTETRNYVAKIMANADKATIVSSSPGSTIINTTSPSSSGFGLKEGLVIGFAVIAVVMTAR